MIVVDQVLYLGILNIPPSQPVMLMRPILSDLIAEKSLIPDWER